MKGLKVAGTPGVEASGKYADVVAPALETLVKFEGTREKTVDAVTFRNVNFGVTATFSPFIDCPFRGI